MVDELTVLQVEYEKCGRSGQYRLDQLIMCQGVDAKLFEWSDEIMAGCPSTHSGNLYDQCGGGAPICRKLCNVWGAIR